MAPAEGEQFGVEVETRHLRRWVAGKVDDDGKRLGDRVADRTVQGFQEIRVSPEGDRANRGARNHEAKGMDRIARVGSEDDVAGAGDGLSQIGEALLRAQGHDRLLLRVDFDTEAP